MERTGIGDQRQIKAFSDLFRDLSADRLAEIIDHLADRRRRRIHPIYGSEMFARRVVVDVDGEFVL